MGFQIEIEDVAGDECRLTDRVKDEYAQKGAIAVIEICVGNGASAALTRDHLVALRAAIDMILNADEARQSPPGRSPSTT